MVFLTDASEFPYKIKDIRHWLIESNYGEDILLERLMQNEHIRSQSENHLSIAKCVEVLQRNHSGCTQNIVLIHLSDANSNEADFVSQVKEAIGITPYVAAPGLEVELNKEDF